MSAIAVFFLTVIICSDAGPMMDRKQYKKNDYVYLGPPKITSLHIRSNITYRFATTYVTSHVTNPKSEAQETLFQVTLPKAAFLTNFTMVIDGTHYHGEIKEKKEARQEYETARRSGHTAGYVGTKARDSNSFKVAINIEPRKSIIFHLIYQEFLRRRLGVYNHVININPGQIVPDLQVSVSINESREIVALKVPPLQKDYRNVVELEDSPPPSVVIDRLSPSSAIILYNVSVEQQKLSSENGVTGQFVVSYDVERANPAGEIQVVDGYFIHYFAPEGLSPVAKNILFILDVSGSMSGTKLAQTQNAMSTILDDLRLGDNFNIIKFSSVVDFWKPNHLVPVNKDTVAKAKQFVMSLKARGSTNINMALLKGISFLKDQHTVLEGSLASMIIFLTDGQPTAGETVPENIERNVRRENQGDYSVFCLGFGDGVDFPLLQKLASQNEGVARKIYEDSDASLQLEGFYKEISTPLLSDVHIKYIGNSVDNATVTEQQFHCFFDGSEIIVSGRLLPGQNDVVVPEVSARSSTGFVKLTLPSIPPPVKITNHPRNGLSGLMQRVWAYLYIKDLLKKEIQNDDLKEKETLKKKVLELSLKYSFVTPLTSMIVTRPIGNNTVGDFDDADEEDDLNMESLAVQPLPRQSLSLAMSPRKSYANSRPIPGRYGSASRANYGRSHIAGNAGLPGIYLNPVHATTNHVTHTTFPTSTPSKTHVMSPASAHSAPVFVVRIRSRNTQRSLPICFRMNPSDGDIYNIAYDKEKDITINARTRKQKQNGTRINTEDLAIITTRTRILLSPNTVYIIPKKQLSKKHSESHNMYNISIPFGNDSLLVDRDYLRNSGIKRMTISQNRIDIVLSNFKIQVSRIRNRQLEFLSYRVDRLRKTSANITGLTGFLYRATGQLIVNKNGATDIKLVYGRKSSSSKTTRVIYNVSYMRQVPDIASNQPTDCYYSHEFVTDHPWQYKKADIWSKGHQDIH